MFRYLISCLLFLFFILFFVLSSFLLRSGSSFFQSFFEEKYKNPELFQNIYSKEGVEFVGDLFKEKLLSDSREITENIALYKIVSISGFQRLKAEEVLGHVNIKLNEPFSQADIRSLRAHLSGLPWIDSFSIDTSILPYQVKLEVKESKPWLVVEMDSFTPPSDNVAVVKGSTKEVKEKQQWLVSTKGVLLEPLANITRPELILECGSLPRMYIASSQQTDTSFLNSTNDRLKYALKSLEYIELAGGFPFTYNTIFLEKMGSLHVEPFEREMGTKVLFKVTSLQDGIEVLSRYRQVIKDIQERGEKVNEVDLRFAKQVVVR